MLYGANVFMQSESSEAIQMLSFGILQVDALMYTAVSITNIIRNQIIKINLCVYVRHLTLSFRCWPI